MKSRLAPDQTILDQFFKLSSKPEHESTAWLLGMVAAYGRSPEELEGFQWNDDESITVQHLKRVVRPLHPQWTQLFSLKQNQPKNLKRSWKGLARSLENGKSSGNIAVDIPDLLRAYKVRKVLYT